MSLSKRPLNPYVDRRLFLRLTGTAFGALLVGESVGNFLPTYCASSGQTFIGDDRFELIVSLSKKEAWKDLPIGELVGKVASQLAGTPYVANTLETKDGDEVCTINLNGLDCVTFFESSLDLARMIKLGGTTAQDFLAQVEFTRYRDGKRGNYTTRLHYTKEWMLNNQKKGVVKVLEDLPGAESFTQQVGFMTSHPSSYSALSAHPDFVAPMRQMEDRVNAQPFKFVPVAKIAGIEAKVQTGDIVGVCSNTPGIDISHTGLIIKDKDGHAHFMNASSKKSVMKVIVDPRPFAETFDWSKSITGLVIARPLEPNPSRV